MLLYFGFLQGQYFLVQFTIFTLISGTMSPYSKNFFLVTKTPKIIKLLSASVSKHFFFMLTTILNILQDYFNKHYFCVDHIARFISVNMTEGGRWNTYLPTERHELHTFCLLDRYILACGTKLFNMTFLSCPGEVKYGHNPMRYSSGYVLQDMC